MGKHLSTSSSSQLSELMQTAKTAMLFLAPLALIVGVMNYFMTQWDPSPHYSGTYRELYSFSPNGAEVIVMGGSNGKYGVDPHPLEACLGVDTLNLCLNGCGPLVFESWYDEIYLRNGQPPKTLVLVLNEYVFDSRGLLRRLEHDAGHLKFGDFMNLFRKDYIEVSTLLYNRMALTRKRAALWHAWFGTPVDEHVDMDQWYHGWAPVEARDPFSRSPEKLKIKEDENRVASLRHFLLRLRNDGVRVIVVNPPICLPTIDLINPAAPRLRELAAETGVEYLDYNHELASDLNQDRSFYMDWEHLNTKGAIIWSERLAWDLCRNKQEPLHD